jgi:hypothetical protein
MSFMISALSRWEESWNLKSFMISKDETIVPGGRSHETSNLFYDFQGWNHCPGGDEPLNLMSFMISIDGTFYLGVRSHGN